VITEGYLARHYQGRRGGRGPAIIDIAQDHVLYLLAREGLFDLGISLKGGTAIRKFLAGNAGRFSTDLDFAGMTDVSAELLLDAIDGATVGQFIFGIQPVDGTRRVQLLITSMFGETGVPARLDLGRRSLWLPPPQMAVLPMPIRQCYEFALPVIPMSRVEEMIADKLARFRRDSLARDLYDLAWFASRPFDEPLVRRLLVLKVWVDVVDDGLGKRPFDPEDVLRERHPREFEREAIGYLTTPVDIPGWITRIRERFTFLRDLDDEERLISRCSKAEEWLVRRQIEGLGRAALDTDVRGPTPPSSRERPA
jgi:predicted nucleotidyltransferase component of viral defense system